LKITYFVNQYPKVSHSFIRREILALERMGFDVQRIALRGSGEALPDPDDRSEQQRTHYVLGRGLAGLVLPTLRVLLTSPHRLVLAVWLATRMADRARGKRLPYHWVCVAEACVLLFWTRRFGARHVHAHFGTNSAEVAMLMRVLGGPAYSFTVHGPEEFLEPMGLEEKVRHSAFVVAISSFGRSQLWLRLPHRDWDKVQVVRCGIARGYYDLPPVAIPEAPRLICVGRLTEAKGQLLLVEAVARLAQKGIPVELVLAGDGPLRSELDGLIEKFSLRKQVRITGWIGSDAVRNELLAARALVLPSFAEGLPVVIMEAMALRRPVIATYVAGIPELVVPGRTGWLVPAGSLDALMAAVQECLSASPETLQSFADEGYRRVVEKHSVETEAAKLAGLFRASLGHRNGDV
jgi:colanic acid/amylovoran biosynthesis glycosyltransferase